MVDGANLEGAYLEGAKLTDEQLSRATTLEDATGFGGSLHD